MSQLTLPIRALSTQQDDHVVDSGVVEPLAIEPNVFPGFGQPIQYMPKDEDRFRHAIEDEWVASKGVTVRERRMLEFIDTISDKPEWDRKVFDEAIVSTWKEEACCRVESLNDDYLSLQMFDFVCTSCLFLLKYTRFTRVFYSDSLD
jgi:hypothetical protein